MQIQQLSVKISAHQSEFDQEPLIPIFHRWIREKRLGDELLIDVADYRHVPSGPGIMLIGHEGHYGLDCRGDIGFCYARKRDPLDDPRPRLREVFARALRGCDALQNEPAVHGALSFDPGRLEVRVMSRLAAPNTAETYQALAPEIEAFLSELYNSSEVSLEHQSDPRQPFGVHARIPGDHDMAGLLSRL